MTFQSALPVAETQIGVAIEATRGTYQTPAYWLPVMGPKYKPDLKLLPDETLQGSMVSIYDEIPGLRNDSHGWDSYPYLDTFPVLLRALLGSSDTLTAAPSSTTLSSAAAAAATTISTATSIASGSWIVIDSGVGLQETHLVNSVSGAGPYTVTLAYPLAYAHASGVAVTGLSKHQFSLLNNSTSTGNQPPSLSLTDYAGDSWRSLCAAQLDSLNIQGTADSLPKYTCSWFSNPAITPSTPTSSFSSAEAPPGWSMVLAIGGTQIGIAVSWEFDLKRNVKPVPAITGTQAYYQLFAGPLEVTAKLTVLEDPSATWLSAFEAGSTEAIDCTLADVKSGYALNLHSTKAKFTSGELDRSKDWVEVPLEVQLLPSSTDALAGGVSPILATVANGTSSTY